MSTLHHFSMEGASKMYIKTASIFCPSIEIVSKKLCRNDIDFLPIKITSIKVRRLDVDFSLIEVTSNKVR